MPFETEMSLQHSDELATSDAICISPSEINTYCSEQMTIRFSRKTNKFCVPLRELNVEHWDVNPKIRGSIPQVSQMYRVKSMIDTIDRLQCVAS